MRTHRRRDLDQPSSTGAAEMKLKAAHAMRQSGESTRVDTTVAMEFAASWKPLMKSNARATRISSTTMAMSMESRRARRRGSPSDQVRYACQDDALEHVRDVLGAIGGGLDEVDDLLPLQEP